MAVEVRYVRDEEEGWTPVVKRRKKSVGCVGDDGLIVDGGSVMCFRNQYGKLGVNIRVGGIQH